MDPLARKYAMWSTYHYAADNPVLITDPTGMAWSVTNAQLATRYFQNSNVEWKPAVNEDGSVSYVSEENDSYQTFVEQYGKAAADQAFQRNCDSCYDESEVYSEGEMILNSEEVYPLFIVSAEGRPSYDMTAMIEGGSGVENMTDILNQVSFMTECSGL